MQLKQHESYMNSIAQVAKSKSEFIVAGLSAKLSIGELTAQAVTLFQAPPPPPPSMPPPSRFPSKSARVYFARAHGE
jgi:hypothetical protein